MTTHVDWTRISVRYAIIGAAGSVAVIVGSYMLELFQVRVDREAFTTRLGEQMETIARAVQEYRDPEPDRDLSIPDTTAPSDPAPVARPTRPDPATKPDAPMPVAPTRQWGVIKTPGAPVYNRAGKFLRSIEAGTLADILDIRNTAEGQLAICRLLYQGREVPDVLVRTRDLDIRRGDLEQANPREKELRVLHAQLSERIAERTDELARQAKNRNPHARRYEKARDAYLAFARKAEALQKKRDDAQSADRLKYADQLRMMLGQSHSLRQEYEASKKQYDDWNAKQGRQAPSTHDSQLAGLRQRQERIENELRTLTRP